MTGSGGSWTRPQILHVGRLERGVDDVFCSPASNKPEALGDEEGALHGAAPTDMRPCRIALVEAADTTGLCGLPVDLLSGGRSTRDGMSTCCTSRWGSGGQCRFSPIALGGCGPIPHASWHAHEHTHLRPGYQRPPCSGTPHEHASKLGLDGSLDVGSSSFAGMAGGWDGSTAHRFEVNSAPASFRPR